MTEADDLVAEPLDKESDAVQHYLSSLLKQSMRVAELRVGNGVVEMREEATAGQDSEPHPEPGSQLDTVEPEQAAVMEQPDTDITVTSFKVAGILLAVPTAEIAAIEKLSGELSPIEGKPDWVVGCQSIDGHPVHVIDTYRLIVPAEKRNPQTAAQAGEGRTVIRLRPGELGLLCDELQDELRFAEDEVIWSTSQSKRPWLAGTAVRQRCAILNVSNLLQMLAT